MSYGNASRAERPTYRASAAHATTAGTAPSQIVDPLSDVLRAARVSSAVVLHETYAEPWRIAIPESVDLARIVGATGADIVAVFHVVLTAHASVELDKATRWHLATGDLFINFGGAAHELGRGNRPTKPTPLAELIGTLPPPAPAQSNDPLKTTVVCGVFVLERATATPLGFALPPTLHVSAVDAPTLSVLVGHLLSESSIRRPGTTFRTGRLLELVFGEALLVHVQNNPGRESLIRATRDEVVWRALQLLHADPSRSWTIDALARHCAISPSRLRERFRAVVGLPPLSYLTQWRMALAAEMLERTSDSVEQIATRLGYTNQPAFTRAFGRHHTIAPSQWRARHRVTAG